MASEKFKKIIYLVLIIIWMLTVFMYSNQNGDKSKDTSINVTKEIVKILTYNKDISEEQKINIIENLDYIVRKLAHFSIYLLGGIIIYNYMDTLNLRKNKKIIISAIIGGIYAIFDELHQHFIAGRSARISDVCIDALGIITGILLVCIVKKIKYKFYL